MLNIAAELLLLLLVLMLSSSLSLLSLSYLFLLLLRCEPVKKLSVALLASADWLPPTSFSQQAFTGAQYGGVAQTRNLRALPQGGVERQRRNPS